MPPGGLAVRIPLNSRLQLQPGHFSLCVPEANKGVIVGQLEFNQRK